MRDRQRRGLDGGSYLAFLHGLGAGFAVELARGVAKTLGGGHVDPAAKAELVGGGCHGQA